jgi:uncharacterized protein YprB with RNaseH-like and TPR domain
MTMEEAAPAVLCGEYRRYGEVSCFTVETRQPSSSRYGATNVGDLAARLRSAEREVSVVAGRAMQGSLLFFDLETTGLNGGAGTYAFLAGCGWFDADGAFVTRQFVLLRQSDERALLAAVSDELSRAGAMVSFNGKSFDHPLIETRYLFHRLEWQGAQVPHLDMLHVARRFWKRSQGDARYGWEAGCSLASLERHVLGHRRQGDAPGFEAPQRYFRFVRSGDVRWLAPVLDHNRSDLLSLAALTATAARLVQHGPKAAHDSREALALGWLYTRAGQERLARHAYERATELSAGTSALLHIESLRVLAMSLRRARLHSDAARCWRRILAVRGCPAHLAREASDALAIHHEYRVRDLTSARRFALRSLETGMQPTRQHASTHRLSRIERKIARFTSDPSRLQFADSPEP